MKETLKPRIFNEENVAVSKEALDKPTVPPEIMEPAAEKAAKWLWLAIILTLALLLIKDLLPLEAVRNSLRLALRIPVRIIYFTGFSEVIGSAGDFASDLMGILSRAAAAVWNEKFYYFLIFGILWAFIEYKEAFISLFRETPQQSYQKGTSNLESKNYEAAIGNFEKALKSFLTQRDRIKITSSLVEAAFKGGHFEKAIGACLEVLELDSQNEEIHRYLGLAYLEKNDASDEAIKEYLRLFSNKVEDRKLLDLLCGHFMSSHDITEDAIKVYKKHLELSGDGDVRNMLCKALIGAGDRSDYAIGIYERIIEESDYRNDVKTILAIAYFGKKRYEDCVRVCESLFSHEIFDKITLEAHYQSLLKSGKRSVIYDEYQKLTAKYPKNSVLKNFFDAMKPLFIAEKVAASSKNDAPREGAVHPSKTVNICPYCAHLNLSNTGVCEKCLKKI